jgi:hypothetical protein
MTKASLHGPEARLVAGKYPLTGKLEELPVSVRRLLALLPGMAK